MSEALEIPLGMTANAVVLRTIRQGLDDDSTSRRIFRTLKQAAQTTDVLLIDTTIPDIKTEVAVLDTFYDYGFSDDNLSRRIFKGFKEASIPTDSIPAAMLAGKKVTSLLAETLDYDPAS